MSSPKRRKLDHDHNLLPIQDALPDILSQINVEISVHDRLSQTLQARIDWALALKAVLEDEGKGFSNAPETIPIRTLASEALANAELPSQIFFATPDYTPSAASNSTQPQSQPREPYRRPPPRQKPPPPKGKPSFLYINALATADTNETQYLLLRCPVCSRTAFSSLQGLLNHARISHSIEWGTHDACIKACAVSEPSLDIDSGIEVGVGPSGIRPGLQTIFERAVGVQSAVAAAIGPSTSGEHVHDDAMQEFRSLKSHSQLSIPNLTQTLGIHEETPALAPFLGKEAYRREIKVYDEDVNIIELESANGSPSRPAWTMTFAPRHRPEPFSEIVMNISSPPELDIPAGDGDMKNVNPAIMSAPKATALAPSSKSRFHFSARVAITDRSLFVGAESTPGGTFSCKWMIAVDNPSYATPVGSVLKRAKVTPICEDANTVYLPVPECHQPPFVVLGWSNTPFLARIELVFNDVMTQTRDGSSHRQPQTAVVEHWVDLDPLKRSSVVLGEEQLVDVELDRLTDVKPPASTKVSFESRQFWNDPVRLPLGNDMSPKSDEREEFSKEYRFLLETAKQFPLFHQAKERSQSETHVPYRLVSSRAQFNSLISGRKQAIKWGRARAIREAYFDCLKSAELSLPDISTTDIFLWLEENGSSTQRLKLQVASEEREKDHKSKEDPEESGGWCHRCGLEEKYHRTWERLQLQGRVDLPEESRMPLENGISSPSCILLQSLILPQLRVQTTSSIPRPRSLAGNTIGSPSTSHSRASLQSQKPNRTLLQSVEPTLVSLVERVVSDLRLPAFRDLRVSLSDRRDHRPRYPIDTCGANRDQVESSLAPLALLAHSVQQFLVELVSKGAQQATLEKSLVMQTLKRGGARRSSWDPRSREVVTVLTSGHIRRGNPGDAVTILALPPTADDQATPWKAPQ